MDICFLSRKHAFRSTFSRLVAAAIAVLIASPASAQLRSGRVERELYQAETDAQPSSNVTHVVGANATRLSASQGSQPSRQRRPVIVAASHTEGQPQSILEEVPAQPTAQVHSYPQPIPDHNTYDSVEIGGYQPTEHHAAGCGCDSCGWDNWGSSGCDTVGGCDDVGCSTCCGGLADIAPTCAAVCPPGCGPLMALWYRMSVRGETPLYWRRAAAPPALVTTATAGTPAGTAGELGQASTSVLLGDTRLNEDLNVGARITLSTWLDPEATYGLAFRYWNAGEQDDTFNFSSDNNSILARPFFNTTVAGAFENDTQLIAFDNQLSGNINVETTSAVDGLELSLRRRLYQDRFTRVDWLYGYQHVSIDEGLVIASNTNVIANNTAIAVTDSFATENNFHGFSYGLMSSRHAARWKMETLVRLGAGNLRREVNISGSTTTTAAGQSNTVNEGLLARNTNSRSFVDDTFIVVPELGINFAYTLRPGLDFNVGYNYLLIPKVAQASQQINDDLRVNLSDPLTGTLDPASNFDERSYWLHSLGLGLQLRY